MGFSEESARAVMGSLRNSRAAVEVLGTVTAGTATMDGVASYEGWMVGEEESCR
jgi:hypothetical protein